MRTVREILDDRLNQLYDRLESLGDSRDRGFAVDSSLIMGVKNQIRYLEEIKKEANES